MVGCATLELAASFGSCWLQLVSNMWQQVLTMLMQPTLLAGQAGEQPAQLHRGL